MASLEYVMAGCLRLRKLTVASTGAGQGCGGLRPRPLPRQGGGLGPGDVLHGGGRLRRRRGGMPWLHSGGSSPVYLVSLTALFLEVTSRMGWALLSSKVWPSGLSRALLPWSSSFWRCQVTQICTALLGPSFRRRYWNVPSHQIQSPVWLVPKGCWTFAPFLNCWYVCGWGRPGGGRQDDEDTWSGWGGGGGRRGDDQDAGSGLAGRVGFPGLLGVEGECASFPPRSLWWNWRWWGWGGIGLEEGVRSLLARVP